MSPPIPSESEETRRLRRFQRNRRRPVSFHFLVLFSYLSSPDREKTLEKRPRNGRRFVEDFFKCHLWDLNSHLQFTKLRFCQLNEGDLLFFGLVFDCYFVYCLSSPCRENRKKDLPGGPIVDSYILLYFFFFYVNFFFGACSFFFTRFFPNRLVLLFSSSLLPIGRRQIVAGKKPPRKDKHKNAKRITSTFMI